MAERAQFDQILEECAQLDKTISNLKVDSKLNASEIVTHQKTLRLNYRRILTKFPTNSWHIDVQTILWKQCFYNLIEEYRSRIQKTIVYIETKKDPGQLIIEKSKLHLSRLSSAFQNFLADATLFYKDLLSQFEAIPNNANDVILKHRHRCCLYLGDVARYTELYSERKEKDYQAAYYYYKLASQILPGSGNPHNQLAVISIYSKNYIGAVYHYCRSLLISTPFEAAYKNLSLLLNKLTKKSDQQDVGSKHSQIKFSSFVSSFIRLHGLLFEQSKFIMSQRVTFKNMGIKLESLFLKLLSTSDPDTKDGILLELSESANKLREDSGKSNHETMCPIVSEEDIRLPLQELEQLIHSNASELNEQLLLQVLVISLFSVHHSAVSCSNDIELRMKSTIGTSDAEELPKSFIEHQFILTPWLYLDVCSLSHHHSSPESYALTFVYGLITKLANKLELFHKDKSKRAVCNKIILILSVFSDWASKFNKYLIAASPVEYSKQVAWLFSINSTDVDKLNFVTTLVKDQIADLGSTLQKVFANNEQIGIEGRARSSMRFSLVNLEGSLPTSTLRNNAFTPTLPAAGILLEHRELNGWLPVTHLVSQLASERTIDASKESKMHQPSICNIETTTLSQRDNKSDKTAGAISNCDDKRRRQNHKISLQDDDHTLNFLGVRNSQQEQVSHDENTNESVLSSFLTSPRVPSPAIPSVADDIKTYAGPLKHVEGTESEIISSIRRHDSFHGYIKSDVIRSDQESQPYITFPKGNHEDIDDDCVVFQPAFSRVQHDSSTSLFTIDQDIGEVDCNFYIWSRTASSKHGPGIFIAQNDSHNGDTFSLNQIINVSDQVDDADQPPPGFIMTPPPGFNNEDTESDSNYIDQSNEIMNMLEL